MKYAESVVDLIGGTPLVRLNRVTEGISATVLAKVEYLNPGGSAKDRIATRIIDAARRILAESGPEAATVKAICDAAQQVPTSEFQQLVNKLEAITGVVGKTISRV